MGKRSSFDRLPRDSYDTPPSAVAPLIPHLWGVRTFAEPCAGAGVLARAIEATGRECRWPSDIEPRHQEVMRLDGLELTLDHVQTADVIVTNPPWTRDVLHPLIEHFSSLRPTWLLIDADWMHTVQAVPYMEHCRKIISVGRVKWIPDSKHTGKENCAWFCFDDNPHGGAPVFYSREQSQPRRSAAS